MPDLTLKSIFLLVGFFGFLRICPYFIFLNSLIIPMYLKSMSILLILSSPHSEEVKQINWECSFPFIYSASTLISGYTSLPYAPNALPQHCLFLTDTGKKATRFRFHKHLHKVLSISGISPERYSGHSSHIGTTSTVARLGISG